MLMSVLMDGLMSLGSENLLFQMFPESSIESLLKRSQFNKRMRKLFVHRANQGQLEPQFIKFED
jgi:hypothetical protein